MDKQPPYLMLLESAPGNDTALPAVKHEAQIALFTEDSGVLALVDATAMQGRPLGKLLADLRPRLVLDLRLSPRFEVGPSGRSFFFSVLQSLNADYVEVIDQIGLVSRHDARLNPDLLGRHVATLIENRIALTRTHSKKSVTKKRLAHSVVLLTDDYRTMKPTVGVIAAALRAEVSMLMFPGT